MKITVNEYEQNSFANSSTCHNGGGYFQPLYLIDGENWKAVISDTSCGDFGSEISVDIEVDGQIFSCYYGSRVEADNQWSNIDYDICKDILEIFSKYLGYHPPIKGRYCWEDVKSGNIDFDAEVKHLDEDSYNGSMIIDTETDQGEYNNPYFPWAVDDGDDEYYDYYAEEE